MISNLDDLKYGGGYPTIETVQKLYDQLDVQRTAEAYLDFIPAMSMQAVLDVHPRDYGVSETGGRIVYVEPGEGKSIAIGLTYNTESIYASLSLDLKQTGPAVIEVPPNLYLGPKAPEGKESNWLATAPGRGHFAIFRLYGPTEPALGRSWKPGDVAKMK